MFEKLFLLVKLNAGKAVINNPVVPEKYREAVMNEASSSIIDVLKGQMESGRLKELIKYFQFSGVYDNPLIHNAANKFANKLNNYYNIDTPDAMKIADELIPPVMHELIRQSKSGQNNEFSLGAMLSKLSGGVADMNVLLSQIRMA
jgi:hypothetical protein